MLKFTDSNFRLAQVNAITIQEVLSSGTEPVTVFGQESISKLIHEYVMKPFASNRMSFKSSCKELLASFIAIELGLMIPEPAIINITQEFATSVRGHPYYQTINNSIGKNFGTKYITGLRVWIEDQKLFKILFNDLQRIFIFDMFIDTADRTENKPNLLTNGEVVYIIDHELSFAFTDIIGVNNNEPWKIKDYENIAAQNHILFKRLKGKSFLCDKFMDRFLLLNDAFWSKVEFLIPNEWKGTYFETIKENIDLKVNNLNIYKTEIKKLLI